MTTELRDKILTNHTSIGIKIDTQEEWTRVTEHFHSRGMKWIDGASYLESNRQAGGNNYLYLEGNVGYCYWPESYTYISVSDYFSAFFAPRELPKSWAVLNDGSQRFKDVVVKYLNENKTSGHYSGDALHEYYGITLGGSDYNGGDESRFDTILTIDEFEAIISPTPKTLLTFEQGEIVEVGDNGNDWQKVTFITQFEGKTIAKLGHGTMATWQLVRKYVRPELPKILDYAGEYFKEGNYVKYGCIEFDIDIIRALSKGGRNPIKAIVIEESNGTRHEISQTFATQIIAYVDSL